MQILFFDWVLVSINICFSLKLTWTLKPLQVHYAVACSLIFWQFGIHVNFKAIKEDAKAKDAKDVYVSQIPWASHRPEYSRFRFHHSYNLWKEESQQGMWNCLSFSSGNSCNNDVLYDRITLLPIINTTRISRRNQSKYWIKMH